MRYIISYDISEDKLRNKVARVLEEFGERVQFSVFECELTKEQYSNLIVKLQTLSLLIPRQKYKIYIYKVEPHLIKEIRRVGKKPVIDKDVLVI